MDESPLPNVFTPSTCAAAIMVLLEGGRTHNRLVDYRNPYTIWGAGWVCSRQELTVLSPINIPYKFESLLVICHHCHVEQSKKQQSFVFLSSHSFIGSWQTVKVEYYQMFTC